MYTNAIVRSPGPDAATGLTSVRLGKPDHPTLLRQHQVYVRTLEDLGLTITSLSALEGHPDAYFVEDPALMFPELAILTRPGAPQRLAEAEALAATVATFRPIARLTAPATLDGGDVLMVGKQVFVGLSERTNKRGAEELSELLRPYDYSITPVRVPAGLHLKSSVTWAGGDVVVLTQALREDFREFEQIVVPDEESYAANVLWVNGTLIAARGFPRTEAMLTRLGLPLRLLDQSEVQKMDGALTCMSLRF